MTGFTLSTLIILPLLIASIVTILSINIINKKEMANKLNKNSYKHYQSTGIAFGMSLGSWLGLIIGTLLMNKIGPFSVSYSVLLGMIICSIIGVAIGTILKERAENSKEDDYENYQPIGMALGTSLGFLFGSNIDIFLKIKIGPSGPSFGIIGMVIGMVIGMIIGTVIRNEAISSATNTN